MAFMRDANNLNWAFVCKNIAAADSAATVVSAATDLTIGEVVVLNTYNEHLTTALSAGDRFKLAQLVGTDLVVSPIFTFKSTTSITAIAANAATQQVTTIGSDGTTTVGLGDWGITADAAALAAVGNSYYVLIEKQDNDEANRSGYQPAITAQVKLTNPNAAINAEELTVRLAEQLREAIRVNDQLEASTPSVAGAKYVAAKVRGAGLASLDLATTENAVCTFGSKTVTFAGAPHAECQVVGNYLLIGFDIYRIAAYASNVVTLDFAFAGTSGTFTQSATAAATTIGVLAVADIIAATGAGIELTATDQHSFDVARDRMYSQSRFNVRFAKDGENVGATITTGTTADEGVGDFRTVQTDFYNSMGNQGQRWVSDTPGQVRTSLDYVASDGGPDAGVGRYSLLNVAVETEKKSLMGSITATQNVRVYIQNDDAAGVDNTGGRPPVILQTVLAGSTTLAT